MNATIRYFSNQLRRAPAQADPNQLFAEGQTFGDHLADRVAAVGGSWSFITGFGLFLIAWAVANGVVLVNTAFDPFPFIFLNLMLSMLAALQVPIIMMSQNRQAAKDRLEARLDYETNMRTESEIACLHKKVDALQTQIALLVELRLTECDEADRDLATPLSDRLEPASYR